MARQIAVFLGSVNADNQKKMLEGMREEVQGKDVNLYVFTNYMGLGETEENVYGASGVMEIPNFKYFDGIIIAPNTIYYPVVVERVLKAAVESGLPLVSIEREIGRGSCVGATSYGGQLQLLEHMYQVHGHREICYVKGSSVSLEAQRRFQAYKDFLDKYNLPYKEENCYQGNFTYETGVEAAKYFLSQGRVPKCVVCANDSMALAVIEHFEAQGYHVPNDVAVVGIDNAEFAELNIPQITTADKNQVEVGRASVREVLAQIEGNQPEDHQVECYLITRGSCGCNTEQGIDVPKLKNKYLDIQNGTNRIADVNRNMMADASKAKSPEALVKEIQKYLPWIDMGDFYLCLCETDKVFAMPENVFTDEYDSNIIDMGYTDMAELPLAFENRQIAAYPNFERGRVLPEEVRQRSAGNIFVVTPVYFQKIYFGYCVSANAELLMKNPIYYSWLMSIGVMLENTRKWMILRDAAEKLNRMWQYDMMTHVYNRAGFYQEVGKVLPQWNKDRRKIFIAFIDVDGLKKVNDNIGHDAGDMLIRAVSESIRQNIDKNIFPMRYGGDEFVIIGTFEEEAEINALMQKIRDSISRMNKEEGYPFTISISIGYTTCDSCTKEEINKLIEEADQEMYKEKNRKKGLA